MLRLQNMTLPCSQCKMWCTMVLNLGLVSWSVIIPTRCARRAKGTGARWRMSQVVMYIFKHMTPKCLAMLTSTRPILLSLILPLQSLSNGKVYLGLSPNKTHSRKQLLHFKYKYLLSKTYRCLELSISNLHTRCIVDDVGTTLNTRLNYSHECFSILAFPPL